jgi:hypothetical protein
MPALPYVIRNSLRPVPKPSPCPSSPSARKPILVVVPINQLRKKGVMMQKANVSHGQTKMNKVVRRREVTMRLSFKVVIYSASRSWCGANIDGKKKSDEEAKKEQIKKLERKVILCGQSGAWIKQGCKSSYAPSPSSCPCNIERRGLMYRQNQLMSYSRQ